MSDRPIYCCGKCPETVGGGVDCTCLGNERCPSDRMIDKAARALYDSAQQSIPKHLQIPWDEAGDHAKAELHRDVLTVIQALGQAEEDVAADAADSQAVWTMSAWGMKGA